MSFQHVERSYGPYLSSWPMRHGSSPILLSLGVSVMKLVLKVLLLIGCSVVEAQSFDHLAIVNPTPDIVIRYNPAISKIINQSIDDEMIVIKVLETAIAGSVGERYTVVFDEGPSDDPGFIINRLLPDGRQQEAGYLGGFELVIPGNGYVYVSGHTNTMFNTRRKYTLKKGSLREVAQPYYYVGLDTVTTQTISLYSDTGYKTKVAGLPAGYKVEVLINSGEDYLIKTPFGLTGWLKIPENVMLHETPVKGIFFAGD